MRLIELMESTITMYHGGRGLEASYRDVVGNKANKWNMGRGYI